MRLAPAVLLFVGLLWPATSDAQSQAELDVAAKLARQALASFKAKKYRRAASKFASAYEISRLPVQLHNAAKSHDLAGDRSAALRAWRRYRAIDGLEAAQAAQADEQIARLEAMLSPPPPPLPAVVPPPPPPVPTAPPPAVATTTSSEWSSTGFVIAGAGVLAAVVGVVFASAAASAQGDVESQTMIRDDDGRIVGTTFRRYVDDRSAINRNYAVGGGLIAAGAIAVVTGLIVQWSEAESERDVRDDSR